MVQVLHDDDSFGSKNQGDLVRGNKGIMDWVFLLQLASQGVGEIHGEQSLAAQSKTYYRQYEI